MKKNEFKTFGEAVKQARKNISFTQKQLSIITRIHRTTIILIENNKRTPSPNSFAIICSELGLNRKDMFDLFKNKLIERHRKNLELKYRIWL